jgi:hypothetical protein
MSSEALIYEEFRQQLDSLRMKIVNLGELLEELEDRLDKVGTQASVSNRLAGVVGNRFEDIVAVLRIVIEESPETPQKVRREVARRGANWLQNL